MPRVANRLSAAIYWSDPTPDMQFLNRLQVFQSPQEFPANAALRLNPGFGVIQTGIALDAVLQPVAGLRIEA